MDKPIEIPSELIEPYLKHFLMLQVESVAFGLITPEETKTYLKGVEYFVTCYCGVHARFATSNMYGKFLRMKDEDLIEICKNTFKAKKDEKSNDVSDV